MTPFRFHRPADLVEAVAARGEGGCYLAGGQSLLGALKLGLASPDTLVDLARLPELQGIACQGDTLSVGAAVTHAGLAEGGCTLPALAALAGSIGDLQVRNMGTLGGALANADPASDHAAGILGLGAIIRTDRRVLAADDFFLGMFETALEPGEIIVAVDYPLPVTAIYLKIRNPASGYPVVGVLVARTRSGVRVAVTGAAPTPFRLPDFEAALAGDFTAAALTGLTVAEDDLNRDLHATAAYRAHLIGVLAARAMTALNCGCKP